MKVLPIANTSESQRNGPDQAQIPQEKRVRERRKETESSRVQGWEGWDHFQVDLEINKEGKPSGHWSDVTYLVPIILINHSSF